MKPYIGTAPVEDHYNTGLFRVAERDINGRSSPKPTLGDDARTSPRPIIKSEASERSYPQASAPAILLCTSRAGWTTTSDDNHSRRRRPHLKAVGRRTQQVTGAAANQTCARVAEKSASLSRKRPM